MVNFLKINISPPSCVIPRMKPILAILALFLALAAQWPPELPKGATFLEPFPQRDGDPERGYEYLIYGDYVNAGPPLELFRKTINEKKVDDLGRTGDNRGIPFAYNAVTTAEGAKVVAPTCLTCHAEYLNGKLIVGLGNNTNDFTDKGKGMGWAGSVVKLRYGAHSPEWLGFEPASRAYEALRKHIVTQVRGVNPADKVFAVLAAHRNAADLSWIEKPKYVIPTDVVPTDVPAWWLMKKKNALYYNGLGRGDFARLSMASGILTMRDSSEARRIDERFSDVMAWIRTIKPPKYPYPVDEQLVAAGRVIFEEKCSKCHGTYGETETYPNLLIDLKVVKTDSTLALLYPKYPEYHNWYNQSWFAAEPSSARLLPNHGYVAPPLDGIWASAPYLHNASVPTLEDLLNSPQRPVYWKRSFNNSDYDEVKMGWNYEVKVYKTDSETYDTTLPGYGNYGHTFGDRLTGEERKAVLEYLKTL